LLDDAACYLRKTTSVITPATAAPLLSAKIVKVTAMGVAVSVSGDATIPDRKRDAMSRAA